jgi:serine/threonine-protein kinase
MGDVYLAEDSRLQRFVALKMLSARTPSGAPLEADMLRAEARAAARLNHPHVASVYDVLESDLGPCLVMEYVEGETLAARLARGQLPRDEATRFSLQLADALSAAHAHGVIHRDVKPGNIQLTPAGSLKLLDLGIASVAGATADTSMTTAVQQTGEVFGTPAYMAPEQRDLRRIGPYTDVYSAGLVMLEMLTGRRATTDVDGLLEHVPATIRPVLAKATARNPLHRYRDGGELLAALSAVTESAPARRWLPLAKGVTLAAVLALATAIAVWTVARFNRVPAPSSRLAIAVLPVLNLSADATTEQLASGMTSLIVHNLSSIPGAVIISGAAAARLRAERTDRADLAAELGITHTMESTLQRRPDDSYRLEAALRDVTGVDSWRDRFDGDILAVQRSLLAQIDDALVSRRLIAGALPGDVQERLQRLPTSNLTAFVHYAGGRAILDSATAAARVDEAIAAFSNAIRAEPGFALAHAGLSDAYRVAYQRTGRQELLAQARQAVDAALAHDPTLAAAHYSLAGLRNAGGDPEGAIASLRTAITLQPTFAEAHTLLGRILFDRGQVDEGIEEVRHAISLRPDAYTSHYALAFMFYSRGRNEEAIEHLKRVTELQPSYTPAYTLLGAAHQRLGHVDAAIGYYEHATRVGPSAAGWSNLGLLLYESGRIRESLEPFLKAVSLDANSPSLRRNAGDAYARLGDRARAQEMYEAAIALATQQLNANRRDFQAISLIAVCEAKLGRVDAAVRHAAEAVVLAPDNRDVLYRHAVVLALVDRPDAAVAALERAMNRGVEPRMANADDDLASLRRLPAFQKLVTSQQAAPKR